MDCVTVPPATGTRIRSSSERERGALASTVCLSELNASFVAHVRVFVLRRQEVIELSTWLSVSALSTGPTVAKA